LPIVQTTIAPISATLATRWPQATVVGLDSSPEMIQRAATHASERVSFAVQDVSRWQPPAPVDVLVSNATLQWVPEHRKLLPRLAGFLAPGGWLAFQVPGNFEEPSHRLLHELAADARFRHATAGVERPAAFGPETYLDDLLGVGGLRVDAWETTSLHVLRGEDPVFSWISGTGARPVLEALDDERRAVFVAEYKALLRTAYPATEYGTVLPFRRIFAVAHRPIA
jgi:trans-aconitate 2-methyltransferase